MTELKPAPDGYPIKLVRDRTPMIINHSGDPGDLFYGKVDRKTQMEWLRRKLAEEVAEYLIHPGVDELSDVHACVRSLARLYAVDIDAVVDSDPRGEFDHGVMMFGRHQEFDG